MYYWAASGSKYKYARLDDAVYYYCPMHYLSAQGERYEWVWLGKYHPSLTLVPKPDETIPDLEGLLEVIETMKHRPIDVPTFEQQEREHGAQSGQLSY